MNNKSTCFTALIIIFAGAFGSVTQAFATDCYQFHGQRVCSHDEGDRIGYFHTYDQLQLPANSGSPRKIHVFLPKNYESSRANYPVVYFNDGQNVFFRNSGLKHTWEARKALEQIYHQGGAEVILVAVHPLDRDQEYTHAGVPTRSCCGLRTYAAYLATILKPFIDSSYRTVARGEKTTIVGSSHGGLAAFYLAAKYPQQFANVIAMSSSFWVGMAPLGTANSLADSDLIADLDEDLAAGHPRIYLDWGLVRDGGWHNSWIEKEATGRSREMTQLLQDRYEYSDDDLKAVEDPDGDHTEASWARRLPQALAWVLNR